ncbi:MAG: hypothetical protein V1792_00625 [Pseudomonadota bacterium]
MDIKYKTAIAVIGSDKILLECPFCGKTLIHTNLEKIRKLVEYLGTPKGKVCPKCNGVAVLKLSSKTKEAIKAMMTEKARSRQFDPTLKLEDLT